MTPDFFFNLSTNFWGCVTAYLLYILVLVFAHGYSCSGNSMCGNKLCPIGYIQDYFTLLLVVGTAVFCVMAMWVLGVW